MKLSDLIIVLTDKMSDYGDIEVKFGHFVEIVRDSKLHEIIDVSVEDFEYGKPTVIIWDK